LNLVVWSASSGRVTALEVAGCVATRKLADTVAGLFVACSPTHWLLRVNEELLERKVAAPV
jgi:hypothetical protein